MPLFLHKAGLMEGSPRPQIFKDNWSPTGFEGPSNFNILQRTCPKCP